MFTPKRLEFVAKYLSDIGKLFFTAGVVKQFFGDEMNMGENHDVVSLDGSDIVSICHPCFVAGQDRTTSAKNFTLTRKGFLYGT